MGYRIKGLWDQGLEGWNDRSEVWDLRIQRDEVWDLKSIIDQGLEGWGLGNQRDQTNQMISGFNWCRNGTQLNQEIV